MNGIFSNNRGIALLMVLWVLVLLSVIVGEFCYTMRTQVNITRNFKETTEAYYIAVAGINSAIEQLVEQTVVPGTSQASDEDQTQTEDGEEPVQWRVNMNIPPIAYGDGEYAVWIDNEGGRVNINLADKGLLRLMLNGFDLDDDEKDIIVDSILDWRDADDLHQANGAEDDYYLSLPKPYKCKNGNFDSVDELLLVRGVTPEIFYGGLDQMVTVVPAATKRPVKKVPRTKKTYDYNRLNINAIPARLWAAFPGMTEDALAQIIEFRKTKNFQSHAELQEIVGSEVYGQIIRYVTIRQSPYFTVHSVGKISGSSIAEGVDAVVCITGSTDKRYQVLQWKEGTPPVAGYVKQTQNQSEPPGKG